VPALLGAFFLLIFGQARSKGLERVHSEWVPLISYELNKLLFVLMSFRSELVSAFLIGWVLGDRALEES